MSCYHYHENLMITLVIDRIRFIWKECSDYGLHTNHGDNPHSKSSLSQRNHVMSCRQYSNQWHRSMAAHSGSRSTGCQPTFAQFEHQIHMFPLIKIANQLHLGWAALKALESRYEDGDTIIVYHSLLHYSVYYSCVWLWLWGYDGIWRYEWDSWWKMLQKM